mmetsp:Transcript_29307/g.84190  ORF Transcript_29307/g.84190 Transcript_29307/m.84190 type:complete len:227 (-) Transcript_29307:342-1022(-)
MRMSCWWRSASSGRASTLRSSTPSRASRLAICDSRAGLSCTASCAPCCEKNSTGSSALRMMTCSSSSRSWSLTAVSCSNDSGKPTSTKPRGGTKSGSLSSTTGCWVSSSSTMCSGGSRSSAFASSSSFSAASTSDRCFAMISRFLAIPRAPATRRIAVPVPTGSPLSTLCLSVARSWGAQSLGCFRDGSAASSPSALSAGGTSSASRAGARIASASSTATSTTSKP